MEQKVISKTEEQCIYLMKDPNLAFYLIIPNEKQVNILLALFPEVTEDIIKTLPKEKDKAIIIPIINNQFLTNANNLEPTSFTYIDKVLNYLINTVYQILNYNHVKVNEKVLLNNHSLYENFNNKYIERYNNRVELYNLMKPVEELHETIEKQPIEETALETVPEPIDNSLPLTNQPEEQNNEILENTNVKKRVRELGFVSYVLLGVLVAVISLVFLYLML